jgi:16S rRNA processing protein RimM
VADRSWDDLVSVGRVARSHGNRGAVIVNPETDFPETRFREGQVLHVRRGERLETLTVGAVRVQGGRPIVTFREIGNMTEAEALAGSELRVTQAELAPLPGNTYYRHDLVGCRVITTGGRVVGTVKAVEGALQHSRLVVDAPEGEVLVPLAQEICVRIDPERREIAIDPPEGLIDLNR